MTFPKSLDQLPFPGEPRKKEAIYREGATVGYKWFDAKALQPLFAFGHGLSYTRFAYGKLAVKRSGEGLVASIRVTNTGERPGGDAVQVYVSPPRGAHWEAPKRLGGFAKVVLWPGHTTTLTIAIDPRLLAVWDTSRPGWTRAGGIYTVTVGHSSRDLGQHVAVALPASHLTPQWKPQRSLSVPFAGS